MKTKLFKARAHHIVLILIVMALGQTRSAAQNNEDFTRSLEGVWLVKTTPRDCATGEPNPAAAFESIYTFHRDGTMSTSSSAGTPLPFHGLWRRELGWSNYSFRKIRILRNPTTNLYSGKQEIGGTLAMSESGAEYSSNEYMIVYDLDGIPAAPRCISSVATRFKLMP
jgi:hypothetical protein